MVNYLSAKPASTKPACLTKPSIFNNIYRGTRRIAALFIALALCFFSGIASAEIIDDIKLTTNAAGEIDAVIKFTVPIQHLRYFPPRKSQYLVIYFNILESVPRDQWQDYESHRSPPSGSILGFTVTTRDLNVGPKIEVQFYRPVEFSLKAGKDNRSIYIHVKPDQPDKKKEGKQDAAQAGEVSMPPVTAPPLATPALPSGTARAPEAQAAIASGVAATPEVVQPLLPKPLPVQLGGKDGLPVFPAIEQPQPVTGKAQTTEVLSLADQIKKANNEAAVLMAKGRDALSAGELAAAIEVFNNTLKLPPNKYSQDAQVWIGIAREKSGQIAKAKLEYESYLKLYPDGALAKWVKDRLVGLNAILPAPAAALATPPPALVATQSKDFSTAAYGSLAMYYYHGASHTDTIATVGTAQSPSSLTVTDQSSLIANVSVTARSYNDEFDNRFVLQDFFSANFLPNQPNTKRLNAFYFDVKNRLHNYSARIGRQSAMGGGVLGRFDGVSAGYGFLPNWRANVVAGQLSDAVVGSKPVFYGGDLDFGVKDPIGGSIYTIKQTVGTITDRTAVGGNLRYFEQGKTAMVTWDYDTQFKSLNMVTVQGTLNDESGKDYNFLVDRRKTPLLSIRSAVNGTTASIDTLLENGWTTDDLISLAKMRTGISNMAQFGVTNHIKEKWQIGADISASNSSAIPESGTLNPDGTTGLEGYVPATPSTGIAWTLTGRLLGNEVITSRDVSVCSLSYTKSQLLAGTTLLLNNHAPVGELWILDTTLRLYWQTDSSGGKESIVAPMLKLGYRAKNNLMLETEGGIELTKATPSALQSSTTNRKYLTMGFRWDF